MIRRPPRSTAIKSSAASDVYKRQALDVTVQLAIVKLLKKLNREKKTGILFISHDLSLVKRLCERIVVMKDGRIVEEGACDQIFDAPKESYTQNLIAAIPRCEKDLDVLKGVSFSIREGEVMGLVGESGCGKSTLSKALLGLIPKYEGVIVQKSEHPQMIFQDPFSSLNPAKKVGWILEEPLRLNTGLNRAEREKKVSEMLRRVGLEEMLAQRYPRQLSGGQRQRVCIAESLMLSPKLLIADEPVSALDVTIQAQIIALLRSIQKEMGLAILFISHDMRVVYQLSQRVMIMKDGEIVESGDVDQVYFHPEHPYTKKLLEAAGILEEGD